MEFLQSYDNKMKSQAAIQKVLEDEAKTFGGGSETGDSSPHKTNVTYDKSANSSPFPDDNSGDQKSMF